MILLQTALVRLGLAMLLGACIGATRLFHLRSNGIGVHALVALGASLFTVTALFGFTSASGQVHGDPTRLVTWILIGSGLLGASNLLRKPGRSTVTGLFTAVTFCAGAVIGVLCGAGWLSEAAGATLLVMIVFLLSHLVKRYFSLR